MKYKKKVKLIKRYIVRSLNIGAYCMWMKKN